MARFQYLYDEKTYFYEMKRKKIVLPL